jgi:epoxyqueuosine reductase QueG
LLTDARLKPGAPVEAGLCRPESCGYACVRACPVGALSEDGRPTDKVKCLKHYLKLGMPGQSGVRCGLCIARCPANKNAK